VHANLPLHTLFREVKSQSETTCILCRCLILQAHIFFVFDNRELLEFALKV